MTDLKPAGATMAVEERWDDGSVLSGVSRRVWESSDAVSYEVAVETVGRLISWYSEKIVRERQKPRPDATKIDRWKLAQNACVQDQTTLLATDHEAIVRVTTDYAERLRELTTGRG
ncbi:hypothetical protein [Frankia sp. Cr2]|uniref:hypothetical protein n=1 Tax=Frankia sp. Cr2 TaxID=3073932 RepID=UPI002AD5A72D|nr:hypothetical protein [Frankia sp. Cr2]